MQTLRNQVAVVTGAASGIGRALALALAGEGCVLALVDWSEEPLAETAALVRAASPGVTLSTHKVDVSNEAQMRALTEAVEQTHGPASVLINNAGVTAVAGFHAQSLEDFRWVLEVNLWGVVLGCKLFLPQLARAPEAHIVNISSIFGVVGIPGQAAYCASKFAVRGFSESIMEELRGTPIGVTVVHPGGIATNIVNNARGSEGGPESKSARAFQKAMPASVAAARIVQAIRKRQKRLLLTREAYLMDAMKRVVPVLGNHFAADAVVRTLGMSQAMADQRADFLASARKEPS